jgi:hypothetical protein
VFSLRLITPLILNNRIEFLHVELKVQCIKIAVTILKLAGYQGIEPRPRVLETLVLPEHL